MQQIYYSHHATSTITIIFLFALLSFVIISSSSAQEKVPVFEVMRMELASDPATAIKNYFTPEVRKEWDSTIADVFSTSDVKFFFAFSSIELLDQADSSADMIYINPWIDGVALMKWKRNKNVWVVTNFAFIRGELIRNEVMDEKNVFPLWMRMPGTMASNMATYFSKTQSAILRNKKEIINNYFSDKLTNERSLSLISLAARLNTRLVCAKAILGNDTSIQDNIKGMLNGIKDAIKSKEKGKIRTAFKTDDPNLIKAIALLPESVASSFVGNWYVEKEGRLLVLMSSFLSPRLFIIVAGNTSGITDWALLGDWVTTSSASSSATADKISTKH